MKINWKSVSAGALAILGVLGANVQALPHNVAVGVTVIGILTQLFTHPAVQANPTAGK